MSYTIMWYYQKEGRNPIVIATDKTLAEAQQHCRREDTHKPGEWFDGYISSR